jgi:hypothetical protein
LVFAQSTPSPTAKPSPIWSSHHSSSEAIADPFDRAAAQLQDASCWTLFIHSLTVFAPSFPAAQLQDSACWALSHLAATPKARRALRAAGAGALARAVAESHPEAAESAGWACAVFGVFDARPAAAATAALLAEGEGGAEAAT